MKKIQINWNLPLDGTIIDFESTHWDEKKERLLRLAFLQKMDLRLHKDQNPAKTSSKKP